MKIKSIKSGDSFRSLRAREVDELINKTILKPATYKNNAAGHGVFNNWDLPVEPIRYLRCKKYDPL